jgi:hypothetical protein
MGFGLGVDPAARDATARCGVAIPCVHVHRLQRAAIGVALGEEDLLADQVPPGSRALEVVYQPRFLLAPGDRPTGAGGGAQPAR